MPAEACAGRIETLDIDQYQLTTPPWEVILRQISPGQFRGRMEYLQVNGTLLYREHWTHRVLATGATPAGYFVFGSPSSPSTRIDWCGGEIHPGRLAFGRPSTEVDFVIPERSNHVALLVPEPLLREYLGEELLHAASAKARHHLGCHAALGDGLVRMIHRLIDEFLEQDHLLTDARLCKAVEMQLLGAVVQAFGNGNLDAGDVRPRRRRLALRRAIEYGEDRRRPISVPQLAAAAGANQRVLELAFHETLNIAPHKYLRWNRMNHARREFIAAKAGSTSVKGIAASWGFTEPGRFAVEYKHLFGESPSETLARRARPRPVQLADALGNPVTLL